MSALGTAVRRLLGSAEEAVTSSSAGNGAGSAAESSGPVQAVWNDAVLAESESAVLLEGRHYFPPEDVDFAHLQPSEKQTTCHWKGVASYHDVVVDGERNRDAAWYYPDPSIAAAEIRDHVAFWRGVELRHAPRE